ncbi:hypothetical protein B0H15DRAFT_850376, partial [Mycena belliarum]
MYQSCTADSESKNCSAAGLKKRNTRTMVTVYTGLPLRNARGPRDLLEALVHAMIGYINLLDQDYQHHDISSGNILLVQPFEVASSSDEMCGSTFLVLYSHIVSPVQSRGQGFLRDPEV